MNAPQDLRVGFIGLGDMGSAIALRIIDAGHATVLWARRDASFAAFAGKKWVRARDPRELGRLCGIVGICVFGDDDARAVLLGDQGVVSGMASGGVIIIHSTISIEATGEIARAAAQRGIGVIDAPVSGARSGAVAGKLSIMAGGEPAHFDRCLPLMRCYGSSIFHLGALGSGQKIKTLNNVLGFANLRMAKLALDVADRLGLEPQAARAVLRSGSGGSFNLNMLIDRLMPDPAFARHAVTMTEKDTRLFRTVCSAAGIGRSLLDQLAEEAVQVVGDLGRAGGQAGADTRDSQDARPLD